MRSPFLLLMVFIAVTACDDSRSRAPISEADKRKYFGDTFIYQGAPFCCIYVGLETNETATFEQHFWRWADQHDIHKPKKHYTAYSGPPLATCKSDHVSVFAGSLPTSYIVSEHDTFANPITYEQISWQAGIWMHVYWPTNGSRITKGDRAFLAPFTGSVRMAPNDSNYPLESFKQLSDNLATTLRSAFPDRSVNVFLYDGDAKMNSPSGDPAH
jgi:hypothetical protein